MQFKYVITAGSLMKSVYILRYNRFKFSGTLHFCKCDMRRIGFYTFDYKFFTIKTEKFFRIVFEKRAAYNLLGRIFPFLIIQTVSAAEIGNSALRRNSRAPEKYDIRRFIIHFLQFSNKFILHNAFSHKY